uniref:Glutaredoxin-3 n=1 Tax=Lygus hesperus TaxID=30085 RepID=A0A0A9YPY9_LYGHE
MYPSIYNTALLQLYVVESHADCKRLKEYLCSLQLSYEYIPCASGSVGRAELLAYTNTTLLPTMIDVATSKVCIGLPNCLLYIQETYDSQFMLYHTYRLSGVLRAV